VSGRLRDRRDGHQQRQFRGASGGVGAGAAPVESAGLAD